MTLQFRNIDVSPAEPVGAWGFEGMLAAIDRGHAPDWRKLVDGVAADPRLADVFEEACQAAESSATVALVVEMYRQATLPVPERALQRLGRAFVQTGLTQTALAAELGTSRSRLSTYLSGAVTPSMEVLVAVETLADERRAPSFSHNLVLV